MSPSATPATQNAAASPATNGDQARNQSQPSAISATPATQNEGGCLLVRRVPRIVCEVCDKVVRERWYVTKMVCDRWCVCDKVMCERWCVTKLCVKDRM